MNQVFTSETYGDLSRKIEEFMENYDVYDYDNVTIVTEKVNGEKPDSYHWKATLIPKNTSSALKELLVEEHGVINLFWNKEDIVEIAAQDNRRSLTNDEVDEIARQLANSDCEYGISWQTIREITLAVCPDAVSMDREDGVDWTNTEMIGV